jgi:hypothetical protein
MESLHNRTIDPPTKLTRFAPDGRDWVLYDTAQEDDFLSWWLQTNYQMVSRVTILGGVEAL